MINSKKRSSKSIRLLINQSKNGVDLPVEIECNLVPTIIPNDLAYYIIQELGGSAFTVYYVLYSQKGEEYDDCCINVDEICNITMLSRSTIEKNLRGLVELGLIKIKAGGGNRGNCYFFPKQTAEYTEKQLSEIDLIRRKSTKKKEQIVKR